MPKENSFRAIIQSAGTSGGAYVVVPLDIEKIYGTKRLKVFARIEGEPYRGSVVRMGSKDFILGIVKDIREKIKKDAGDSVNIVIKEDSEPRVVEIPDDLEQKLRENKTIHNKFNELSYSHKREYVDWINQAKKDETRQNRIDKMIHTLKEKE